MRWGRRGAAHPPPWWPAGESWPPRHGHRGHGRGRGRFVRRAALLFAFLLLLSGIGASTLVSLALSRAGIGRAAGTAGLTVLALAFLGGTIVVFLGAMRRVGLPLSDLVGAADRVADGDYTTRVMEAGPPLLRTVARAFNDMTGRLHEQDRQRRDLLADIAHELRTPLAVVQGRLEGLLDGLYPRDDARLEELLAETRMLARLVADLGTLAQAERGALALQKEPMDVGPLLHEAAGSLAAEAAASGVTVRVEDPRDIPLIDLDPLRMREVLVNVISNAVRHTPAGTTVSVTAEAGEGRVVIRVHDTGPGLAPEEAAGVFDRFHKGAASAGSGLGLAIARSLVVAHGGEIALASERGRGTTVTVRIPL